MLKRGSFFPFLSISWSALLLSGLFTGGCVLDGPDVMSAARADRRLARTCALKVINEFPNGSFTLSISGGESTALCAADTNSRKDEMVLTSAVDYCDAAVKNINAASYDDFAVLYLITRTNICDIKPIRPLDFSKKPFQWGI